jgi:hypothetical protein
VIRVKNPLILFLFLLLVAILAYTILFVNGRRVDLHYPVDVPEACSENLTKSCSVGNCTGVSTCRGGNWGSCKLDLVCEPGSRISCSEVGCVYGFRECDECGSGYGPCR